jgi:hypothetical protein
VEEPKKELDRRKSGFRLRFHLDVTGPDEKPVWPWYVAALLAIAGSPVIAALIQKLM